VPTVEAAPELPLVRGRFNTRPLLTMGDLSQLAGLTNLVIGRDYIKYWPRQVDPTRCAGDNLYLMKMQFHPGQLLYREADKEATEALRQEAREKRVWRTLESAGSSTSSSRRSQGRNPAVSPAGKWGRLSPSQSCNRERNEHGVRGSSPILTTSTTLGAGHVRTSTPIGRGEANRS
jgi:hypothetical protein